MIFENFVENNLNINQRNNHPYLKKNPVTYYFFIPKKNYLFLNQYKDEYKILIAPGPTEINDAKMFAIEGM